MTIDPHAGQPAQKNQLIDLDTLLHEYYARPIDVADRAQQVVFGTSGHRGSSLRGSFNEPHVLAITQAICDYRRHQGTSGPLYLGKDTHALSEPASRTALEVLAANRVDVVIDDRDGWTPTPVISFAILKHNWGRTSQLADGIVLTPSHNPPEDGGLKYNPPTGGPAEAAVSRWIERRANDLLSKNLAGVVRTSYETGRTAETTHALDFVDSYVADLNAVVDMAAIRNAGLRIGVDPLGGAAVALWRPIAERYGLEIDVTNEVVDPTFAFMPLDHDGRIRMDCSSPYAMANLIRLKDRFDIAIGNDPDADRHGIVTPCGGLMNPNHYLAAAISYLFTHRPEWSDDAAVGKTVVTSSIVDRVAARTGRRVVEVPVGFKWFVPGLLDGSLGFAGEESAGASFLRQDGTGVVHRQGRNRDGPAGLRTDGPHRTQSVRLVQGVDAGGRSADIRAHRCGDQPGRKGPAVESFAVRCQRVGTGRRSDSGRSDDRARKRRAHRWTESRDLARLVCRTSVGYGGGLQALHRKLPKRRSPAAHPGRSGSDREPRVDGSGAMNVDALDATTGEERLEDA